MSNRPFQEPQGSYMDNVRVKIAEKYKPPPRIGLPMSYAQRLTLNKQIQDTIPSYEFVLEKTVIEKMHEWKTARSVMLQQLNERVAQAREEVEEKEEKVELAPSQVYQPILMQTQAPVSSFSNILTPIPLKQPENTSLDNEKKMVQKSPLNISDFEDDTYSPFDNMELKSINDMEELAQVLQGEQEPTKIGYVAPSSCMGFPTPGASNYTYTIPTSSSYGRPFYPLTNGYYYPATTSSYNNPYTYHVDSTSFSSSSGSNIPEIVKTLEKEIKNTHLDNTKVPEIFPKAKNKCEESEEFTSLPKSVQDMSRTISSMGFPLSRVTRVCKVIGNDRKKVVDHLLAMSELLDLGFSETSVSNALLQCDNDRDKALDILIS